MFEEIRKPRILSDIPMMLIRTFPALYYYQRFVGLKTHDKAEALYVSKREFLSRILIMIGEGTDCSEFSSLALRLESLAGFKPASRQKQFTEIVLSLAELCGKHKSMLRGYLKENRDCLRELYQQMVVPLRILLLYYDEEDEKIRALENTLVNFCHYQVSAVQLPDPVLARSLVQSDFGIFTSTHPAHIHEDVRKLHTFSKPGMALTRLSDEAGTESESIRHGSQLQKAGFPVLFKVFTPIRLFTTVDKEYMRFNLSQAA